MYYILHGDDELSRAEQLKAWRSKLAGSDPAMADLNTSVLDGRLATMGELRHVCDSIPFFGERRLVVVNGLLLRLAPPKRRGRDQESSPQEGDEPAWKRAFVKELKEYLPKLPETTRLLFVETERLEDSHPILKFALSEGKAKGAYVELHNAPKDRDLPDWIQRRAREKKRTISDEAAKLLATLIGRDLWQLDLELDKLLLYADGLQVTEHDVRALVSRAREESVFDLVDCIGRRQTGQALKLLHSLLEDEAEPLQLLGMLVRQVRILMQVGELRGSGLGVDEIARRIGLHPFPTEKAVAQIHNFSMWQLEAAYERLLETDWAIKTGEIEDELALDLLVVALTAEKR